MGTCKQSGAPSQSQGRIWLVDRVSPQVSLCPPGQNSGISNIAVFPILADVVEVKTGSGSTVHWSNDFIRLNGWLRNCFAQLIIPLDIDGIGQNWEDSNTVVASQYSQSPTLSQPLTSLCQIWITFVLFWAQRRQRPSEHGLRECTGKPVSFSTNATREVIRLVHVFLLFSALL